VLTLLGMTTLGAVKLAKHLKAKRRTLAAFAESVGTSKSLVCMWRKGVRVPGLEFALAMQREAGIAPSAWLRPSR
jgi:transcriptional regulator with XRE-family HTH domain